MGQSYQEHSILLMKEDLRIPIEKKVSEYFGKKWVINNARDMSEFACHPCAIFHGSGLQVFVKYVEGPEGYDQFENELTILRFLSDSAEVPIPQPVGITRTENGCLLIFEALNEVRKQALHWKQIGRILAKIHRVKSAKFGFTNNGFWGPIPVDNTYSSDWANFYLETRLLSVFRLAIDSGNLPKETANKIEDIIDRFPALCGPNPQLCLLHGDAQQNNFISTDYGTYIVDPSIYYGNAEIDLAAVGSWQPAPDDYLETYREEMDIDPGFIERGNLWRVANYLAGVGLEGRVYLVRLENAIADYK